jgi:hypothetical protein
VAIGIAGRSALFGKRGQVNRAVLVNQSPKKVSEGNPVGVGFGFEKLKFVGSHIERDFFECGHGKPPGKNRSVTGETDQAVSEKQA